MSLLFTIIIIILLCSLLGGGLGYSRMGAVSFGPVGLIILVLVILYAAGFLR